MVRWMPWPSRRPTANTVVLVGSGAVTVNVHLTMLAYDPVKDGRAVRAELDTWAKVIREGNIKAQ